MIRLGYGRASVALVATALLCVPIADLHVTALHPGAELARLLMGVLRADVLAVHATSVVLTVAFAALGVGLGATAGFVLALGFARFRGVRVFAASIRSVHELFWALLLLQVTGLSATTGILAIGIPYAGIFAKVFAEMIEESDLSAERVLAPGTSMLSRFAYARLPDLAGPVRTYLLYRLECGLRSTLVLGFIGLPTMGFELESYFRQGHYAEAAGFILVFYVLIATRTVWARASTLPFLILGSVAALVWLTVPVGGQSIWISLARFLGHDIVPRPLRDGGAGLAGLVGWGWPILRDQMLPGIRDTLVLSQLALVAMAALALALLPLVTRQMSGPIWRAVWRGVMIVLRSTPDYVIAYVLLQMLGPSMLPAIIALSVHNGGIVAFLTGGHADALVYRQDAPRGLNLYFFEILPRVYGQYLAYVLYRWEIIVRESAIFGILGVTTLGFYVDGAIAELRLDVAVVLIAATGGLSMAIDAFSRALRRRLRINDRAEAIACG